LKIGNQFFWELPEKFLATKIIFSIVGSMDIIDQMTNTFSAVFKKN
jgi:hypothetical protein